MRRVGLRLLLLVGAAVLAGSPPAAHGGMSQIAFSAESRSTPGGGGGIYVVGADGRGLRPVGRQVPTWGALTAGVRRVTDSSPTWSPNARRLAFLSPRDYLDGDQEYERNAVYVMARDGSSQRRLTRGDEEQVSGPAWSPDGAEIAFLRRHVASDELTIEAVAADGRRRRVLVRATPGAWLGEPAWSPDGRRVAFARASAQADGTDVWTVSRSGADGHLLVRGASAPTWSPDGHRIAFVTAVSDRPMRRALEVVDADGGHRRRVLDDVDPDTRPSWSPDGSQILVGTSRLRSRFFDTELVAVRADGSCVRRVAFAPRHDNVEGSWSAGIVPGDGVPSCAGGHGQAARLVAADREAERRVALMRGLPVLWPGPNVRNVVPTRLAVGGPVGDRSVILDYFACGVPDEDRCGSGFSVEISGRCNLSVSDDRTSAASRVLVRGVPGEFTSASRELVLFTGRLTVVVSVLPQGTAATRRRTLLLVANRLRPGNRLARVIGPRRLLPAPVAPPPGPDGC